MKINCIGIIIIALTGLNCFAQNTDKAAIRQVMQNSQEAVNAIAMYPRETRKVIFEASEYPEVITKLNAMQKESQEAFATLISTYSKEEQENIWNLTRYDDLIADLAAHPKMKNAEINDLLDHYPAEIHKVALREYKKNYNLLDQIDQMNVTYDSNFKILLKNYPPETTDIFRQMIQMPEVLDILFKNMPYTVIVGNFFKKNPERILHKTDSLNLVLTQKNAQEANEWKKSISEDPEAQKEYIQAAQEYAQDNGYQADSYNTPMTEFDTNYSPNPYSWWLGYPTWYPDNSWNPNPYWYDWGFYYGPGKQTVFFGLPSSYFMEWYFYYPKHLTKYAELSNHYYNYYDNHRTSLNYNSVSHSVNSWRTRNKDIITSDWERDKMNRVERFRQFGQMEDKRIKYNAKNPGRQINQTEFIRKTPNAYYFLADDISKRPNLQRDPNSKIDPGNMPKPVKRRSVATPGRTKPEQQPVRVNSPANNTVNRQRPVNVNVQPRNVQVREPENTIQMRDAQQFHQNTWNQPVQQRQQPQQPPRQQPQQPQQQPRQQPQQQQRQAQPQQQQQPQRQVQTQQNSPAPATRQQQPARQNVQVPTDTKRR